MPQVTRKPLWRQKLLIHIVTSNNSVPVKAFLDKELAKEFYEMMRDDKTLPHCSFGLVSMAIEDASQPPFQLTGRTQ